MYAAGLAVGYWAAIAQGPGMPVSLFQLADGRVAAVSGATPGLRRP
ncbi:hypothetical protein ABT369_52570 [Dactylosporangium sp. NPDC000244]